MKTSGKSSNNSNYNSSDSNYNSIDSKEVIMIVIEGYYLLLLFILYY